MSTDIPLHDLEVDDSLTMKELLQPDPGLSSDTYLGTRMDQKALNFHTQLHDWSEAQKLSALTHRHTHTFNSHTKPGEAFLPVKKLAHIEYWTKQVNRYYLPNKGGRPKSGSFMKIDVTKYNMRVDKDQPIRSKSAIYPNRQHPVSASTRLTSVPRRRFFGHNDVHTVNNKLVESQMHYSAQRKDVYSAKTRKSNKSAKTEEIKSELLVNENDKHEGSSTDLSGTDTKSLKNGDDADGSNIDDLTAKGHGHVDSEVMQPQIVSRSWSNRMLNVISIDDCKLTCRYRPQMIKENHTIPDDLEVMQKARANKLKHESVKVKENKVKVKEDRQVDEGNEADNEASDRDTEEAVGSMETLNINDEIPVDTNNNMTANACHTINENDVTDDGPAEKSALSEINSESNETSGHKSSRKSSMSGSTEHYERNYKRSSPEEGSKDASKTSYGRLTTLYSQSENSKEKDEKKRKKKMSRTSRINYAINDMVAERKVMNSLERDFDTRTAEFGRTVVEKTEGSATFRKIHANLRKKIDTFVNTHSAVKTKDFYERSRSNSVANSVTES